MLNWDPTVAPLTFFSTAAGPDIADLIGPSPSMIDIYEDGTPIAKDESAIANGVGGGGSRLSFFARADVHALLIMIAGAWAIHMYLKSE